MNCPECENVELEPWEINAWHASGPAPQNGHQCPECEAKFFEYPLFGDETVLLNLAHRDRNIPLGDWIAAELGKLTNH